jgi:chloride channel 3/4/5
MIYSKGHPYLDTKREVIHTKTTFDLTDLKCEALDVNRHYKITDLEWKLKKVNQKYPNGDSGLVILEQDMLVGFIASNELQHAITQSRQKEMAHLPCFFKRVAPRLPVYLGKQVGASSSHLDVPMSLEEHERHQSLLFNQYHHDSVEEHQPNDYTRWMDQAPVTVAYNTTMEMTMELFVKLGIKTLMVVEKGRFLGIIHKKDVIAYLRDNIDKKQL